MKSFLFSQMVLLFLTYACSRDLPSGVKKALELAGENRKELEKVLERYRQDESDSLKLQAACFLIENMPGHFSYDSTNLDHYRPVIDTINSMKSRGLSLETIKGKVNPLMDSLSAVYPLTDVYSKREDDLSHVKSGMLISNIDLAFKYYDQNPFKDSILFEDFLEYVLPYRIQNGYCLENWRSYFTQHYSITDANNVHQLCDSLLYNFNDVTLGWRVADNFPYIKLDDYLKSRVTHCPQKCWFNCLLLRSFGIPVAIDFVPACRVHEVGHEWNTLKFKDGFYPFEPFWLDSMRYLKAIYSRQRIHPAIGPIQFPKVYRETFTRNISELLEHALKTGEEIPPLFRNPFITDVTGEYLKTFDIETRVANDLKDNDYAYACVLGSNQTWVPVAFGKIKRGKATFHSMGTGNVYLPCIYKFSSLWPVAYPILLNDDGSPSILCPDTVHIRKISVTHVAYPRPELKDYKQAFIGAAIEASNDRNFERREVLFLMNKAYEAGTWSIPFNANSNCRFIRLSLPCKKLKLNEIKFFVKDKEGEKEIKGKLISSSPADSMIFRKTVDDDLLTAAVFTSVKDQDGTAKGTWFGYDFGKPVIPGRFEFYFAFDANIRKEGIYELLYWDFGWKSLGIKDAVSTQISFDHVPENALLMIRIHDTGKYSRIFTYSQERQHWW
ncbi:MAG: hypothetical protein AAGU19_10430 [Prolixibacteraceae bacterium]